MRVIRRGLAWVYGHPYLLLVLTMLMWGGNAVAGRLAVGEVSPMALTFLRWVVPVAILGFALRRQLLAHRQVLVARWPSAMLMGTFGFTVFNAPFYLAAHHTTAVNITILQGSMPVFLLVGALLFNFGDLWMLGACCLYAGYTVALHSKPAVPG